LHKSILKMSFVMLVCCTNCCMTICLCADTLLDNLTVYEMLAYTSELKNPMYEPVEKKRAKVETVINQLGLNGCRGVRIGNPLSRGISGSSQPSYWLLLMLLTSDDAALLLCGISPLQRTQSPR